MVHTSHLVSCDAYTRSLEKATHVDFRDKILKLFVNFVKLKNLRNPRKSDLEIVADLSKARKWLKFLKLSRGVNSIFSAKIPVLTRIENISDLVQMIADDLDTLQNSGILGLFGFKLDGVGDFADQAWFIWSAIACFNSFSRLRLELGKRGERDEEKMRMEIILFLKLFCELGDSVIALTPKGMKKSQGWVVASASLGSISALCSLYKFFYPYFSISFLDDDT